jgi:hypothetical protein
MFTDKNGFRVEWRKKPDSSWTWAVFQLDPWEFVEHGDTSSEVEARAKADERVSIELCFRRIHQFARF